MTCDNRSLKNFVEIKELNYLNNHMGIRQNSANFRLLGTTCPQLCLSTGICDDKDPSSKTIILIKMEIARASLATCLFRPNIHPSHNSPLIKEENAVCSDTIAFSVIHEDKKDD